VAIRLRTVDQVQAGAHSEEVAVALGLHRTTVYGWLAKYRDGGRGRCWPGRYRDGRRGWSRCRCGSCGTGSWAATRGSCSLSSRC